MIYKETGFTGLCRQAVHPPSSSVGSPVGRFHIDITAKISYGKKYISFYDF